MSKHKIITQLCALTAIITSIVSCGYRGALYLPPQVVPATRATPPIINVESTQRALHIESTSIRDNNESKNMQPMGAHTAAAQ